MARRWYEEDDSYMSQRFPTFYGGADVYSEVSPYDDLNDYGFRRPKIGPTKRGPKDARIGPAERKPPVVEPESWMDRLGGMIGYPNKYTQPAQPKPMDQPQMMRSSNDSGMLTGNPRFAPSHDTSSPSRNMLTTMLASARANSTGANAPLREPSIYGEGASQIPNAVRIAMQNARTNSNANVRPEVFQAQGVNVPGSGRVTNPMERIRPIPSHGAVGPSSYTAAARRAAGVRRAVAPPPVNPVPAAYEAPVTSPIQAEANPYEAPTGESGWTRSAPSPFMQGGPAGMGAWNKFDITQEGGRNEGAEGNFPGTQAGPPEPNQNQNQPQDDWVKYNWAPSDRYNKYLESEPDRSQYQPKGWARLLNAASAGMHGYTTHDIGEGVRLGTALNERPYQEAVESWKRRGTGLARAVEMEDKRYNIDLQNQNRIVDNRRQMQELELRREQHLLDDQKFQQKVGMDNWKKMTEGWKPGIGPNGTMVLYRMGQNGMEQQETSLPNEELTAAQKLAEGKAQRDVSTQNSIRAANTSRANTTAQIKSRESEGQKTRQHQATENMLGRAVRLETAGANRTGGEDYATPGRLLGSPDFKDLSQSDLVRIINAPDNRGKPRVEFTYEDPDELQAAIEKAAGGDGKKMRELADQYKKYMDYVQLWGGGQ